MWSGLGLLRSVNESVGVEDLQEMTDILQKTKYDASDQCCFGRHFSGERHEQGIQVHEAQEDRTAERRTCCYLWSTKDCRYEVVNKM